MAARVQGFVRAQCPSVLQRQSRGGTRWSQCISYKRAPRPRGYFDGPRGDRLNLSIDRQQNIGERRQLRNSLYCLRHRHCTLDLVEPRAFSLAEQRSEMQRSFLLVKSGEVSVFTTTKGKALLTTTTGALPRPNWYTENLRGLPLSQGFSRLAYREQHFDCLACHVAAQHRAGIDIFVDGDTRLDDDIAGRGWVSYVTERVSGIGAPRVEVPPAGFMADKGPGDLMWEVIETRMTPSVTDKIGETTLQLDRAYKAIAPMTDRPVKIGSISAQILALMLTNEHYKNGLDLLMDLSIALNKEYHALADAGAPLLQVEEPAIHQVIADPKQTIKPEQWVEAFNVEA